MTRVVTNPGVSGLPFLQRAERNCHQLTIGQLPVHSSNSQILTMEEVMKYTPGNANARKALFKKLVTQATKYRNPDEDLQAKVIINACYDIKANAFSVTPQTMIKLLQLYRDYVVPETTETL